MAEKGQIAANPNFNRAENTNTSSSEMKEQLQIIRESKTFLLFFLAALILSYFVISIQEEQLVCAATNGDCDPPLDTCPMRITANLLSLFGLVYFYDLSRKTISQPVADERLRLRRRSNHVASLLTLTAGIIRLIITLDECTAIFETPNRNMPRRQV